MPNELQLPEVSGVISAAQVAQTVDAIASVQQADGNIPWVPGGQTDPWNEAVWKNGAASARSPIRS